MSSSHRKLIFFIVDGCSAYYFDDMDNLPGFKMIKDSGVASEYAKPIFPTLSLPNYYSMFTGLFPEQHGMFSNEMYDKDWKEKFYVTNDDKDRWFAETPEPLWIKTGRLGIRTCLFWPWFVNFKSPYSKGQYLHHGEPYATFVERHGSNENEFRLWIQQQWTQIVDLFKDPCDQFIVIYWGTTDSVFHKYGPRSPEAMTELKLCDWALMELQEQLNAAQLLSTIDIFVAADHGHVHVPKDNYIFMDGYIGGTGAIKDIETWCEGEAYLLIYTLAGKEDEVYHKLRHLNIPHVSVVRNEDLPEHYHLKKARRAPPIWIFAEPGYSIVNGSNRAATFNIGVHGYDNECKDMRGVCLGRGPGFNRSTSVLTEKPVSTLDYYLIMCQLLGIKED